MPGTWLTSFGLLVDIYGFFLAWTEYERAVSAAHLERLSDERQLQESLTPIERIALMPGRITKTIEGKEPTITRRQVLVIKRPAEMANEEHARDRRHRETRLTLLSDLRGELLDRREVFRTGAWMIFAGFLLQFLGALPVFN